MYKMDHKKTVIAGVDIHKYKHTVVLMTPFSEILGHYEIGNAQTEFQNLIGKLQTKTSGKQIVFGLEDTGCNGKDFAEYLTANNYVVYSVPTSRTDKARKHSVHIEKTDYLDAIRVAQEVLLQNRSDKLPLHMITERTQQANEVREIIREYRNLAKERTRMKNQLHVLLFQHFGKDYRDNCNWKGLFGEKAVKSWISSVKPETSLARRLIFKLKALQLVLEQLKLLKLELDEVTENYPDAKLLKTMPKCGSYLACAIASEISDITKYPNAGALAKYAGIAPRSHSSGNKIKHFINKRGKRSLNYYIHMLALAMLSKNGSQEAMKYYQRKVSEGKSKMHAIRCLKRRLLDIIFSILSKQKGYYLPSSV